jgi:hypothetical protein
MLKDRGTIMAFVLRVAAVVSLLMLATPVAHAQSSFVAGGTTWIVSRSVV